MPEQAKTYALAADWDDDQKRCYMLSIEEINMGKICHFGSGEGDSISKLFFWGDSHAAAYLPAIKEKTIGHGLSIIHASRSV